MAGRAVAPQLTVTVRLSRPLAFHLVPLRSGVRTGGGGRRQNEANDQKAKKCGHPSIHGLLLPDPQPFSPVVARCASVGPWPPLEITTFGESSWRPDEKSTPSGRSVGITGNKAGPPKIWHTRQKGKQTWGAASRRGRELRKEEESAARRVSGTEVDNGNTPSPG